MKEGTAAAVAAAFGGSLRGLMTAVALGEAEGKLAELRIKRGDTERR